MAGRTIDKVEISATIKDADEDKIVIEVGDQSLLLPADKKEKLINKLENSREEGDELPEGYESEAPEVKE